MSRLTTLWVSYALAAFVVGCGPKKKDQDDSANEVAQQLPPPIPAGGAPDEMGSVNRATLTNLTSLVQSVQASPWHQAGGNCAGKTIAIFDNGFAGLDESKGVRLPPYLTVEKAPANAAMATSHGTKLAEVIWGICTGSSVYSTARPGPYLRLYNTNGYSNLAAAVDAVTASPVDIVLYSQVWEFGGNFDGRGFINNLVNKVTSKGILWVNAAGNYGQTSWQGPISFDGSGNVNLPHEQKYLRFTVNAKQTPVKITMAWNDFTDDKAYRTTQDLDLYLEDATHREITSSRMVQDGQDHKSASGYSSYAREQITAVLDAGVYFLRITSPRASAFHATSRVRIGADGASVVFIDQTPEASVMIPADNVSVLTVGASDVPFSSEGIVTGNGRHKPEVLAPSILQFDNGAAFAGSSSAAAVAAGVIALYESKCGSLTREEWVTAFGGGSFGRRESGSSAPTLKLPATTTCNVSH